MNESTILHNLTPDQLQSMFDKLLTRIIEQGSGASEKYFTREKVSEMLGVDFSTLFNWNKKDILKSHKIGGRVVYRQSDIEAAINKTK